MTRVEQIWGTAISVDVRDPMDPAAVDDVFEWFREVDRLFSTWRDDSEIVRIERGELDVADADPQVREVLALSERLRDETGGAFDIRATGMLTAPHGDGWCAVDPSGIVKGWAVQRAAMDLVAAGASTLCINAGGDVVTRGRPGDQPAWRVGVQHPWDHDHVAVVLSVTDAGVATSGRYERGDHVVDPRTGRPAHGLASATVVHADLAVADAYATAIVALGRDGLTFLASRGELAAVVVTDDHQVVMTPAIERYVVPPSI